MKRLVSSSKVPVKAIRQVSTQLENKGAAGSAEFGVDAVGDFEKDFVAGHGVGDARAAEDAGVHGAEGGDGHGDGDPQRGAASGDMLDYVTGDMRGSGYGSERQDFETCGAENEIDQGDERYAADERAGEIALRVFNFTSDQI